jgi:hypothetical protein
MVRNWSVQAENAPGSFYAWSGPALLSVNDQGDATEDRLTGFFFRETRYLSRLALRLNGELPFRCSAARINANKIEFTYIYPSLDVGAGGGSGSAGQSRSHGILRRDIDLKLTYEVHPAWLDIVLCLTSRWDPTADVEVTWELAADYRDMPEVQSGRVRPSRVPGEVLHVLDWIVRPEVAAQAEWIIGDAITCSDNQGIGRAPRDAEARSEQFLALRQAVINGRRTETAQHRFIGIEIVALQAAIGPRGNG